MSQQKCFALLANLHYVEGNNFLPRHSAVFPCINETQNTLWFRGALQNQRTLLVQLFYSCFHGAIFTPTPRLSLTQATVPPTIRSDQRLALEL